MSQTTPPQTTTCTFLKTRTQRVEVRMKSSTSQITITHQDPRRNPGVNCGRKSRLPAHRQHLPQMVISGRPLKVLECKSIFNNCCQLLLTYSPAEPLPKRLKKSRKR
ncbi:hypothetical protein K443DRAFT_163138 [Laccaria amethystina LaAM-08-1]|uniref:Uncharacterized protein n=1 Tax=Laccaria amethystina LaAM-08-1 TaxID=1095629 RepID=A0A0C9XDJ3_9AGAR|nr:hypothetical protein K443DRAFT_163138 [Laccaria amethystina LaAM-08-1]